MQGRILHVNVSRGGLPKRPVAGALLTPLGFDSDSVAHPKFHGGPNKAVLLITSEGIAELIAQGYPLFPGAMGENLTTEGVDRYWLLPGTRLRAGAAVLEVADLRASCRALDVYGASLRRAVYRKGMRPDDPRWGLGGFYLSVLEPGRVCPGDAVEIVSPEAEPI